MDTSNKQKPKDIHERIYEYVIHVILFTKLFSNNSHNNILVHQLIKSVSSIGANDKEADASESRKDFIAKYSIVKKETSETLYWIQLLCDINNNNRVTKEKNYLVEEGIEIYKIVTSIIIKTRNKPS